MDQAAPATTTTPATTPAPATTTTPATTPAPATTTTPAPATTTTPAPATTTTPAPATTTTPAPATTTTPAPATTTTPATTEPATTTAASPTPQPVANAQAPPPITTTTPSTTENPPPQISPTSSSNANMNIASGGASTAAIQSLREQISKKESVIAEKSNVLEEKKKQYEDYSKDADEVRKDLKEAQEEHGKVKEQLDAIEAEKKEIQPKFEHAQANVEARAKAKQLQAAITDAEEQKKALEAETKKTDSVELQSYMAKFKEEQAARQTLSDELRKKISELQKTIENKIALIATEGSEYKDPVDCLNTIAKLTKDREREILNVTRQLRELTQINATKERARSDLQHDGLQQIEDIRKQKDEEVRRVVVQIQQERDSILSDIHEVRVVNREQAYNLKRGQLQKEKTTGIILGPKSEKPAIGAGKGAAEAKATTKALPPARQTQFREAPKQSESEILLAKANRSLQEEYANLTKALQDINLEKGNLQISIKALKDKRKKDTETRRQELRETEIKDFEARQKASQLEEENTKLEEQCEALASTLKSTKQQFLQLRGKFETPVAAITAPPVTSTPPTAAIEAPVTQEVPPA